MYIGPLSTVEREREGGRGREREGERGREREREREGEGEGGRERALLAEPCRPSLLIECVNNYTAQCCCQNRDQIITVSITVPYV